MGIQCILTNMTLEMNNRTLLKARDIYNMEFNINMEWSYKEYII